MAVIAPVLIQIGYGLVATGIGYFAHWVAAKHTRKSAAAAAIANSVAASVAKAPVTQPAKAK